MSRPKPSSRANGRLSRGPKTQAGKDRSKHNALRHGIFARESTLIDPQACAEEFTRLFSQYQEAFPPIHESEIPLLHELTRTRIRLNRLNALETSLFNDQLARQPASDDPSRALLDAFQTIVDQGRAFETLLQRQGSASLRHSKALQALLTARSRHRSTGSLAQENSKTGDSNLSLRNINATGRSTG